MATIKREECIRLLKKTTTYKVSQAIINLEKKLLFPFVLLWICTAYLIYKIGDLLRKLGNRMSGYRFDNSIGTIHTSYGNN